jgi:hypothetical protein
MKHNRKASKMELNSGSSPSGKSPRKLDEGEKQALLDTMKKLREDCLTDIDKKEQKMKELLQHK